MSKTQAATSKPAKAKTPSKAQLAKGAKLFGEAAMKEDEHQISEEQRKEERRAADKARSSQNAMSFAVQQLGVPVAPQAATPPQLTEEYKAELKKLQEKFGVQASTAKERAPKAEKVIANDTTRPAAETLCGKIWAAADELSKLSGTVATIAALKMHADTQGVNEHTIKTQYARWRKFNGIEGRLPKIQSVHQTPGEYEGIPPVQK